MKGDLQAMMTRRQFAVCLATATGLMATLARPSASLAGAGDGFRFVFDGFDGKPLPSWDELGEERQQSWIEAAHAAIDKCIEWYA